MPPLIDARLIEIGRDPKKWMAPALHLLEKWEVPMSRLSLTSARRSAFVELETLASLPCGCVVSAYRAPLFHLVLVSLEAKGPYCVLAAHQVGQPLRPEALSDGTAPTLAHSMRGNRR